MARRPVGLVNRLTANPIPIEFGPKRPWDRSGKRFGSTRKATETLGFTAGTVLEDGLTRTIEWMRQHMDFTDACIAKHAERMAETEPAAVPATR